ncbi:hypothetical protein Xclt_11140 [Xanthomonas axonopodis pv. clitoriae]|uniref:Secreted protein n=1 Tax=Xanthomonas axonopodis pv. clitoriae TaxID=487828 RepID=A0AB73MW76_9XANT|nr:hypothetical protein Xclt_11140 [Xanthomonas axonopodis pv. clitoriae]
MLNWLRNRIACLHVSHLVGGVVQRTLDNEHILALCHRRCLFAQYNVVDPVQTVRPCQMRATCCQPGTVVVVVATQALFETAHRVFCLAMQRVLWWRCTLHVSVSRRGVVIFPIHLGWKGTRRDALQCSGIDVACLGETMRLLIVDDGRLHRKAIDAIFLQRLIVSTSISLRVQPLLHLTDNVRRLADA